MPLTPRMKWPSPSENQEPWFDAFTALVNATDSSCFASREDRHLIFSGGGTFTFLSGTGVLSWASTISILSAVAGFQWQIAPGSVTLEDGNLFYLELNRYPSSSTTVTPVVGSKVPSSDTAMVFAVRVGDRVYFRNGRVIANGNSGAVLEVSSVSSPQHLIPNPRSHVGTAELEVGHSYIGAGTYTCLSMLGSLVITDVATLTLRKDSDSSVVTTIGGVAGGLAQRTGSFSITALGWYYWTIKSNGATGTVLCTGITF